METTIRHEEDDGRLYATVSRISADLEEVKRERRQEEI